MVLARLCFIAMLIFTGVAAADDAPINYEQHVQPILRAHCFTCHDQEKSKGGLALDSFGGLMTGGAGGEVVFAGDLDSSRLWQLVSHADEPKMPPSAPRLAEEQLAVIRHWIEQGLVDRPGGKAAATAQPSWTFETPVEATGPGAMPASGLRQPVVYSARAAAVSAIACSPNAPLIAISGQRQVALYHTETNELLSILPFPEGQISALIFSRDGSLLLAAGGRAASRGLVSLYDVASGDRLAQLGDELDAVLATDIAPTLQRVALGGPSRRVRLFDTASRIQIAEMKRHTDWVLALAFSPDGKWLATADRQGGLWLWEADTGLEVQDLPGHKQAITGLSWRADSKILASCSEDGNVSFWSVEDGKPSRTWAAHPGGALALRFAKDGGLVTAGRDRKVRLWDASAKLLREFSPMSDIVLQAAIAHDGSRVFGGDWTGQTLAWKSADGSQVGALAANPPTLEMRLASAEQMMADHQLKASEARRQLDEVVDQLQQRQRSMEQLIGKLGHSWQQAIAQLLGEHEGEPPPVQPDVTGLEQQLAQLSADQKATYDQAAKLRNGWVGQKNKAAHAQARRQAAQAELDAFHARSRQLQERLIQAEKLTQAAETAFEQVEREQLALAQLVESASHVAQTAQAGVVGDVAMEHQDEDAQRETARPAKHWASEVQQRAAAELEAVRQRLQQTDLRRHQATRDMQRAADQSRLFEDSYGQK